MTTKTGAVVEVLRRFFGTDDIADTFTAAGLTRSYTSLTQAAAEAVDARVFGGMHFRAGCVQGVRQGEKVGRFAILHELKVLKTKGKPCAVKRRWNAAPAEPDSIYSVFSDLYITKLM